MLLFYISKSDREQIDWKDVFILAATVDCNTFKREESKVSYSILFTHPLINYCWRLIKVFNLGSESNYKKKVCCVQIA